MKVGGKKGSGPRKNEGRSLWVTEAANFSLTESKLFWKAVPASPPLFYIVSLVRFPFDVAYSNGHTLTNSNGGLGGLTAKASGGWKGRSLDCRVESKSGSRSKTG